MKLLRVRDSGAYRDVTYRNSYPTWNLSIHDVWESYEPLEIDWLVPIPKKYHVLRCILHHKQRATPSGK